MDIRLTKDADKMLCEIYAAYMKRRSDSTPKRGAKDFTIQEKWPQEYLEEWNSEDGTESLAELGRAGMIKKYFRNGFLLNDEAIIYMENRFQERSF